MECLVSLKKIKFLMQIFFILDRAKTIILYYVDLLKDTTLAIRLFNLLGVSYLLAHPTSFSSQVVFISLTTAFLPIILAAVIIAANPFIVLGFKYQKKRKLSKWKIFLAKVITFVLSPLVPALLFDVKEREKKDLHKMILDTNHNDPEVKIEIEERRKFLLALKNKILVLKKLELTIEVVPQITILSLMILLKNSNTNLETGLEAVFVAEPILGMTVQVFLVFNILWSLQTEIFTSLKVKKEAKGFLPSTGSMILLVKNTLTITTRITCIVMYFVPFLGCLNLASHWRAEQIKLEHSTDQFPEEIFTFYYEGRIQTVDWKTIYRSNIKDISITEYTLMKLNVAYAFFWVIILLQIVIITVFQVVFYRVFTFSGVCCKILYALEHAHMFDTAKDWDEEEGDLELYKKNWKKAEIEFAIGTVIHWAINIMLLIPILYIGKELKMNIYSKFLNFQRFFYPCSTLSPSKNYWTIP